MAVTNYKNIFKFVPIMSRIVYMDFFGVVRMVYIGSELYSRVTAAGGKRRREDFWSFKHAY